MKNPVKERLIDFITYLGLSKNEFEKICGLSSRYVSTVNSFGADKLALITSKYPDLNIDWLLNGRGAMLLSDSISVVGCSGTELVPCNCKTPTLYELIDAEDVRKPVLPAELTYRSDIDIFEYIKQTPTIERSRVIVLDLPIDMWHVVRDDSLLPDAKRGDTIALSAYPVGEEDPIPGTLHAVDTRTNGIIVRKLKRTKQGYLAIAPNKEHYPDMVIPNANIIRIFRIVFLGRLAL